MISTTTVHIHMQKQRRLRCSGTSAFINFWLHFFDIRRERQFLSLSYHTMLTTPKRSAHLVVQSQLLNTVVGAQLQLSASMADNPNLCLHSPKSSLSKSSNSQDHRFRAWCHSHSSPFSIRGLLWLLWFSYPLCACINCTQCYASELGVK